MNDLETLRPEVREAIHDIAIAARLRPEYQQSVGIIRAELRRLAGERDELRTAYTSASQSRDYWKECSGRASECATLKAQSIHPRAQLLIMLGHANDRAERAESELAALKARIAGSDAGIVTQTFSHLGSDGADTTTVEAYPPTVFHSTAIGQRVRLVVDNDD